MRNIVTGVMALAVAALSGCTHIGGVAMNAAGDRAIIGYNHTYFGIINTKSIDVCKVSPDGNLTDCK